MMEHTTSLSESGGEDHSTIEDMSSHMPPNDEFHYVVGDGVDIITDFKINEDLLILSEFDPEINFIQNGDDVVIAFSDNHQVILLGVGEITDPENLFS